MELLPVALPTAGPAGPAAANFLAGENASLSAHPAGRLASRDSANEGTAVPLEILPSEQDSRLASLPQLGQAGPALAESFSAVWLSAVQMTEGQPTTGSQAAPLTEDPSSQNPTAVPGSGAAEAASLTTARKGATAAVMQTVIPAASLAALVQAATTMPTGGEISAHAPADATLPGTAETATQSVAAAEIREAKRNSSIPAATDGGLEPEGITHAGAVKESGIQRAELTEARIVPAGQRQVAPHHDNASLLSLSKALNIGRSESGESAANEHASAKAIQFANASTGLNTGASQGAAAEGPQNDLPAIATLTEEGRKLGEGIAVTEKLSSPSSSPESPSPLLPLAGRNNRDSSKAAHAGASQGAVATTAAANVARLSAMLATGGQEPSASAETAFKAEIRPSISDDGQAPAASNTGAAHPARQGQQRATANLPLQSPSSASSTGEAELLSDSSLSQQGNLPAKATASYVADLPGSRLATVSGAPRQAAPTAPPPAAELYAAGLDAARPTTKQAGDVTVQLRSEEYGTANIRFREHAGQVQVTVRAGDPQLVQSLRSGLDQLKSGLDTQGFQTTVWSGSSSTASRRGDAEGSLDTYHRAHEDPSGENRKSNDHSGRGNQQAEEWMDELE